MDDGIGDFGDMGGMYGEMPPGLPASGMGQAASDVSWTGTVTPGGGTGTSTDPITGTATVKTTPRSPFRVSQPSAGNGAAKPKSNVFGWVVGLLALAAGGYAAYAWWRGTWPFSKKPRKKRRR